jgi:hypothetical protein
MMRINDENKPVWPTWAVGVFSGVETFGVIQGTFGVIQ